MFTRLGDISGHVGRNIDGFQGVYISKKNQEVWMLLEFCYAKHICIDKIWYTKADRKTITYGPGCNKSHIDFRVIGKIDRMFFL